jgi:hypothetical protein
MRDTFNNHAGFPFAALLCGPALWPSLFAGFDGAPGSNRLSSGGVCVMRVCACAYVAPPPPPPAPHHVAPYAFPISTGIPAPLPLPAALLRCALLL